MEETGGTWVLNTGVCITGSAFINHGMRETPWKTKGYYTALLPLCKLIPQGVSLGLPEALLC